MSQLLVPKLALMVLVAAKVALHEVSGAVYDGGILCCNLRLQGD